MIDLKRTSSNLDDEFDLSSTASFNEEGQIIVSGGLSDGEEVAQRGDSDATGTTILGFSKLDDTVGSNDTDVIANSGKVPSVADSSSKYLVDIGHLLITSDYDTDGDVRVQDVTNDTWLTLGSSVADGTFIVDDAANGKLGFHSAQKGIKIKFWARCTMTAAEKAQKYQSRHVNRKGMDSLSKVGAVTGKGQIFTDQYDTTVSDDDWGSETLRLGADGSVTTNGSAADVSSAMRVIATPTVDSPFLGLAFDLPASV